MTKLIRVTRADIEAGRPIKTDSCPIALAMARVFGRRIIAGHWGWQRDGYDPAREPHPLPVSAVMFMRRFDKGETVRPFRFNVEIES